MDSRTKRIRDLEQTCERLRCQCLTMANGILSDHELTGSCARTVKFCEALDVARRITGLDIKPKRERKVT